MQGRISAQKFPMPFDIRWLLPLVSVFWPVNNNFCNIGFL